MAVFRLIVVILASILCYGAAFTVLPASPRAIRMHSIHVQLRMARDGYASMTVPQLKEELRQLSLPVSGVKAVLVERLQGTQGATATSAEAVATQPTSAATKPVVSVKEYKSPTEATRKIQHKLNVGVDWDLEDYMAEGARLLTQANHRAGKELLGAGGGASADRGIGKSRWDGAMASGFADGGAAVSSRSGSISRTGGGSSGGGSPKEQEIQRLIDRRSELRQQRQYEQADDVRDDLRTLYGVEIYDKEGRWECTQEGLSGSLSRFSGAAGPAANQVKCSLDFDAVQDLVDERTQARRVRDFSRADEIRDYLAANGIAFDDQGNGWASTDGSLNGMQS